MSTNTVTEPPAAKKRGRPKKVAAEVAKTIATAGKTIDTKKTGIKAAVGKGKAGKTENEKKAPARTAKPIAPKDATTQQPTPPQSTIVGKTQAAEPTKVAAEDTIAPEPARTAHQPTPATPATSKILDQVRATGTLKVPATTSTALATPSNPPPSSAPSQAPPRISRTTTPPTESPILSQARATTIPLPRAPLRAPSPKHANPRAPTVFAAPAPASHRPPQPRLIEPAPDLRLPDKYKPTARRLTAIIVGIPVIIVFGWELFQRWRGVKVQKKWEEGKLELIKVHK
jgi:hypothetical protein